MIEALKLKTPCEVCGKPLAALVALKRLYCAKCNRSTDAAPEVKRVRQGAKVTRDELRRVRPDLFR